MKETIRSLAVLTGLFSAPAWSGSGSTCTAASTAFGHAAAVYLKGGKEAFMDRFLQDSPLAEQVSEATGVQKLREIEGALGSFLGWSVISRKSLGERACYLIATLEYTDGPAFLAAMYYDRKGGTVPLSIRLEGDPEPLLSNSALVARDQAPQ